MNKSLCFSKGCPNIIKKRDKMSGLPYYVCGYTGKDLKHVQVCVKDVMGGKAVWQGI